MGAFGGLLITNKGRALQAKAQTGVELHYTRIAIGDGSLTGQSIVELNALISEKKTMAVTKLQTLPGGKAVVGTVLDNQGLAAGFYFRELGIFATDPDDGEILYCYGNAGATADYIPAGGGPDVYEKHIDAVVIVGNAANVTATIDQSLIFVSVQDFTTHQTAAVLDHPDGSVTTAKIAPGAITAAKVAADVATQAELDAKFDPATGHEHTGAAGDAPQIGTAGIADGAVTAAKVAADVATQAELDAKFDSATGHKHTGAAGDAPQIGTTGIADGAVTLAKLSFDPATQAELDAAMATHVAAADPHPQYVLDTQVGAAAGVASLDGGGHVPDAQIPAAITRDTELAAHTGRTDNPHNVTAAQVGAPAISIANITYYVDAVNGNDANDGLAAGAGRAFKTITKAISMIPQIVNHNITINVAAGTYNEEMKISGFSGAGSITITSGVSSLAAAANYIVLDIVKSNCSCSVTINGFTCSSTVSRAIAIFYCQFASIQYVRAVAAAPSWEAVYVEGSNAWVGLSDLSNHNTGILANAMSTVYSDQNQGTGNTTGLFANRGSTIGKNGPQPAGTTAEGLAGGGAIR